MRRDANDHQRSSKFEVFHPIYNWKLGVSLSERGCVALKREVDFQVPQEAKLDEGCVR